MFNYVYGSLNLKKQFLAFNIISNCFDLILIFQLTYLIYTIICIIYLKYFLKYAAIQITNIVYVL